MKISGIQLTGMIQMTNIVAALIASACMDMSGPSQEACKKGLEAGAKQSGIERTVNSAQKKARTTAKEEAIETVGKKPVQIVGGGIFLAKSISKKSITTTVPNMGLADKIKAEIGVSKYSVKMEWSFP